MFQIGEASATRVPVYFVQDIPETFFVEKKCVSFLLIPIEHDWVQTCLAIMAEVEERLLRMDDFEDIVSCLKMEPVTWSDDKLRGLLTAAYLSSVSEDEIQLACKSVTAESLQAIRSVSQRAQDPDTSSTGDVTHGSQLADSATCATKSPTSPEGLDGMQTLGGIDDLMQHELDQLTWAGPSGEGEAEGPLCPESAGDHHSLLRLSADIAPSGCEQVDVGSQSPEDTVSQPDMPRSATLTTDDENS